MTGAGLSLPLSAARELPRRLVPAFAFWSRPRASFTATWGPSDFPFRVGRVFARPPAESAEGADAGSREPTRRGDAAVQPA